MKMLANMVLIKHQPKKEQTDGGLILPDSAQKPSYQGTIVSVGPGSTLTSGEIVKPDIKKDDEVYFNPAAFVGVEMPHGEYMLGKAENIWMVLDKEDWIDA